MAQSSLSGSADSGLPPGESTESLSETHQAESKTSETNNAESTQTLSIPTNGSSPRKIEANRRNAQKSTGPKTPVGKVISSWNSKPHGLLSKTLPTLYDVDKNRFNRLLKSLQQDLEPVGTLEEVLVGKIAREYWRFGVAAQHEPRELGENKPFYHSPIDRIVRYQTMINRQLYQAINRRKTAPEVHGLSFSLRDLA